MFEKKKLEVVPLSLATLPHQVVHIVPSGWKLVPLGVASQLIDYRSGFVAFQQVVGVFDVLVENFASLVGIFFDHIIVRITGADKEFRYLHRAVSCMFICRIERFIRCCLE